MARYISIVFCIAIVCDICAYAERPEALLQLERRRYALETAHIELSRYEPRLFGEHQRFYTMRVAGENVIITNRGDEDGVFDRKSDGQPARVQMKPLNVLRKDGQVWMHHDKDWGADHFPNGCLTIDPRSLGLTLNCMPYGRVEDNIWLDRGRQPSPRKYIERMEGDYHVIRVIKDTTMQEWWLDTRRDNEVARYLQIVDDDIVGETRSVLAQYDGIWYPHNVAYYSKSYMDGKEPYAVIRVHYASFNQPEHPLSFEVKDIGIEAGIHITEYDPVRNVISGGKIYDGNNVVSDEEYLRRVATGDIKKGPTVLKMAAEDDTRRQRHTNQLRADSEAVRIEDRRHFVQNDQYLTVWQEYTRQFIERYKLNDQQSQKAWMICLECEAEARGHLAKLKSKIDEIQERLEKASKSKEKAEQDHAAELRERRHKLFEPIERIFERQLKPRLEKLPTRAQREEADAAPSDTPAARKKGEPSNKD